MNKINAILLLLFGNTWSTMSRKYYYEITSNKDKEVIEKTGMYKTTTTSYSHQFFSINNYHFLK